MVNDFEKHYDLCTIFGIPYIKVLRCDGGESSREHLRVSDEPML